MLVPVLLRKRAALGDLSRESQGLLVSATVPGSCSLYKFPCTELTPSADHKTQRFMGREVTGWMTRSLHRLALVTSETKLFSLASEWREDTLSQRCSNSYSSWPEVLLSQWPVGVSFTGRCEWHHPREPLWVPRLCWAQPATVLTPALPFSCRQVSSFTFLH